MAAPKKSPKSKVSAKPKQKAGMIKQKMKLPWLVVAIAVGVFVGVGGYVVKDSSLAGRSPGYNEIFLYDNLSGSAYSSIIKPKPNQMYSLGNYGGTDRVIRMAQYVGSQPNGNTKLKVCAYNISNNVHYLVGFVVNNQNKTFSPNNRGKADYIKTVKSNKSCP